MPRRPPFQRPAAKRPTVKRPPETEGEKRPLKTLERVLSKAGFGSRTEARSWIGDGRVAVNGLATRNPDQWVDLERDYITLDGKQVRDRARRYILLYKPKGYVTTYKDPEDRPTVYHLLEGVDQFVAQVGRLDLDTSGLLLLTNDTQLAEALTNPERHVPKKYLVKASAFCPKNTWSRCVPGLSSVMAPRIRLR